jgi:hypothetical protein
MEEKHIQGLRRLAQLECYHHHAFITMSEMPINKLQVTIANMYSLYSRA